MLLTCLLILTFCVLNHSYLNCFSDSDWCPAAVSGIWHPCNPAHVLLQCYTAHSDPRSVIPQTHDQLYLETGHHICAGCDEIFVILL